MQHNSYLPCLPEVSWYIVQFELGMSCDINGNDTFKKQTTRNRFSILSSNGIQTITIPVESTHGLSVPYSEIKISSEFQPNKVLTAIKSAYGKSAYFDYVFDDLSAIFNGHEKHLFELNKKLFEWTLTWCKNDLKSTGIRLEAHENLDFEFRSYLHVFSDRFSFHPNLSILDVIFNKGQFDLKQLGSVKKS